MTDTQATAEKSPSQPKKKSSSGGFLLFLKILQALCLALLIFCAIATYFFPVKHDLLVICDTGLLAGFIFFFLIRRQIAEFSQGKRVDLAYKAKLFANLLPKQNTSTESADELIETRERALEYCQELIDDYDRVRVTSRNFYYVLQVLAILLAGVTPILVVVEQQTDPSAVPLWLKWSPVILPAIAAIISSFSTSFPLETSWQKAYRVVENLQAEQEKFVLGVTKPYRAFMIVDNEEERRKKLKFTIENFIIEVNKIHLQQMGSSDEKVPDEQIIGNPQGSSTEKK